MGDVHRIFCVGVKCRKKAGKMRKDGVVALGRRRLSPCLKGVGAEPVGYDRAGQTLERGIHYLLMGSLSVKEKVVYFNEGGARYEG
jgi:hypothetical protein